MNQCACDIMLVVDAVIENHESVVLGDMVVEKLNLQYTSGPYYRQRYNGIVIGDVITETRSSWKN